MHDVLIIVYAVLLQH